MTPPTAPPPTDESPSVTDGFRVDEQYMRELLGKLVQCAATANGFPDRQQHNYYRTASPPFGQTVNKHASMILNQLSNIQIMNKADDTLVSDIDDIADKYDSCVDLLDHLLEDVDMALDDIEHPERSANRAAQSKTSTQGATSATATSSSTTTASEGNNAESLRPQRRWHDIDNSNAPFKPKITAKPNAMVPLERSVKRRPQTQEEHTAMLKEQATSTSLSSSFHYAPGTGVGGPVQRDSYPHPYEHELHSHEFSRDMFCKCTEQIYRDFNSTPCVWVNTEEALVELAAALESVSEFAVDLEHHSYRTFQGFVCLMQISTREQDYLIDTLELRDMLHLLNTSFTNPRIVKVLHGADNDIIWMQRDFGLYIVNLFDTGQASRVLEKPKASLAYLLAFYCSVDADKKFQLADWRVRPLPSEMVKYARQDTHYLLYIYDRLRNEILSAGSRGGVNGVDRMKYVLNQSKDICLRRYEKERFEEVSYLRVLNKFDPGFKKEQTDAFRAIFKWRDMVARREDESVRYVLPNHMMVALATVLPTTAQNLITTCNPVPRMVRRDAKLLLKLIAHAAQGNMHDDFVNRTLATDDEEQQRHLMLQRQRLQQQRQKQNRIMSTPQQIRNGNANGMSETPTASSVTVSPITAMMDRMNHLESPVMTTDQLFGKAGWVEDALPVPSIKPMSFTFEEKELDIHALSHQHGNDNDSNTTTTDISLSRANRSSLFDAAPSHTNATTNSSTSAESVNLHTISKISDSFSFANIQSPKKRPQQQQRRIPRSANITKKDTLNENDAVAIRDMAPPSTPMSQRNPQQQEQQQQQEDTDLQVTPPDEKVPKSLSDIYKISKKNRKQKFTTTTTKHSRKSKVSSSLDFGSSTGGITSAGKQGASNSRHSSKHSRKSKSFSDSSPSSSSSVLDEQSENSFLRKIGWM